MGYKLIITERAEELLDNLVFYLLHRLKSDQAASHLLDCVDRMYTRIEENLFQFPRCKDINLKEKGYREAVLPDMKYVIIFRVDKDSRIAYVLGIFHCLENYGSKM